MHKTDSVLCCVIRADFFSKMYFDSLYSQSVQTLKNGQIALKLKRLYTYASKYALVRQWLKMSSGFGKLGDTQRMLWATQILKINFLLSIVSFREC